MKAKTLLPPGFRFHPTDIELVQYYLKRKVTGKSFPFEAISEIELYKFAPWDLPGKSHLHSKDREWYFFCPQGKKYPKGRKANRATDIGYWKATGKDRSVIHKCCTVGKKKTLVFHVGKAPQGSRTDWVMYEYRLEDQDLLNDGWSLDAYVLCKIFQKSGPGPKIGEQYGAPFNEEDWEDDTIVDNPVSFPCATSSKPLDDQPILLEPTCQQSVATDVCEVSSTPDLLDADGMLWDHLAECLIVSPPHSENANNEISSSAAVDQNMNEVCCVETGICEGFEDLCFQGEINNILSYAGTIYSEYDELEPVLTELGCEQYVELNDIYSLWEGDPSDFTLLSNRFVQHPLVENPSSSNLNNMHIPTFSTTAVNPLSVGTGLINDQSAVFLEGEDFGRTVPEMSAPVYEVEELETILQEFDAASQMT